MNIFLMMQAAGLIASLQGNHRVEIDGKAYRVHVKGETVTAVRKSVIVMRTPERGEALREAVIKATGCRMKDGYWVDTTLTGTLDCSNSPSE